MAAPDPSRRTRPPGATAGRRLAGVLGALLVLGAGLVLGAVLVLVPAARASAAPVPRAATASAAGRPAAAAVVRGTLAPGTTTVPVVFDGRSRQVIVHVPPRAQAARHLPLVLNLHGATSNALEEEAYSAMNGTADHDGFVVAYPSGTPIGNGRPGQLGWNAGLCCGLPATSHVDDVGFLLRVIDDVAALTPIDRSRVYVTGISNGGMMSYALAARAAGHIAAAASVSGQVELPSIHPARPVAVLEFHSVDDPIALWAGVPGPATSGYRLPPVMQGIRQWVAADHCRRTPTSGRPIAGAPGTAGAGESAVLLTWSGCGGGATVALWRLTGSGHVWPGSPIDLSGGRVLGSRLGRSTDLVDADQQIWAFFSRHRLGR